jgi:hypothetical protein
MFFPLLASAYNPDRQRLHAAEVDLAELHTRLQMAEISQPWCEPAAQAPVVQLEPDKPFHPPDPIRPFPEVELNQKLKAMRHDFDRAGGEISAVDDDLGLLERHVDRHMTRLDKIETVVEEMSSVLNNHADSLDELTSRLIDTDAQLSLLNRFRNAIAIQDGRIVIRDVDLLTVQGP